MKDTRFPVWEKPGNLTTRQQAQLAWNAKAEPKLHRAYLLKEALRLVFQLPDDEAVVALEAWISSEHVVYVDGGRADLPLDAVDRDRGHRHERSGDPGCPTRKAHVLTPISASQYGAAQEPDSRRLGRCRSWPVC